MSFTGSVKNTIMQLNYITTRRGIRLSVIQIVGVGLFIFGMSLWGLLVIIEIILWRDR